MTLETNADGGPRQLTEQEKRETRAGLGLGPVASMSLVNATARAKFNALGAKKIGFNCFDLLRRRLLNGTTAQSAQKLDWIASTGANIVRIMHPAYHLPDFQDYVYAGAIGDTVTDSTFRPEYLAKLDECFDLCAARGIKLWISLFWWEQVLPGYFGETVAASMSSTTTATVRHMAAHHRWFAARYKNHPAMGVYSFGNEYHMGDGTDYATAANLGAVFSYLADQIRSVDPDHIITADMLGPSAGTAVTRELPESYFSRMRLIYAGLDAWAPHIYGNDTGFVGRNKADGAIGSASNNLSGYESCDALMAAFRSEADAQDKPLLVGEFGIPTDIESDSASGKAGIHVRQMARGSDLALVWNVQLSTQADTNQLQWYIEPGTTRSTKFANAVAPNQGTITARAPARVSATTALKTANRPTQCWRSVSGSPNGRISFVSDATMAGDNGFAWLFWISLYSNLTSFQIVADFRAADANSGAVLLGENATPNQLYVDFRKSGGSSGNSIGAMPALQTDRWYHVAIMHQQDPSLGSVIDVWIDGLLYKSYQGNGAAVSPAAGTACTIGGATNGAPVRLQDFAVMPYASADDIGRHLAGEVLPQSWVHARATGQKIIDASRYGRTLTIGSSVTTERL